MNARENEKEISSLSLTNDKCGSLGRKKSRKKRGKNSWKRKVIERSPVLFRRKAKNSEETERRGKARKRLGLARHLLQKPESSDLSGLYFFVQ
jgi:hypothetical protein